MNSLIDVIWLGIIEGITEFLPISSTGHLLIAEHWLGHRSDLFNVGNSNTIQAIRSRQNASNANQIQAIVAPRVIRFGVRVSW